MVRAAFRVPLSGVWPRAPRRDRYRTPPGDRALVRAGRGRQPRAAPRATWIPRSSACRSRVNGLTGAIATWSRATAGACRCTSPASTASGWRACATAPGSRRPACIRRFRCIRRWCSTSSIPGPDARSAAAPITWRIPAGAATTTFPVNANEAEGAARRAILRLRPHARADGDPRAGRESGVPADARPAEAPPKVWSDGSL